MSISTHQGAPCEHADDAADDGGPGLIEQARELGVKLPPQLDDPNVELTGELIVEVIRDVCWHFFPGLAPAGEVH
jgi:hypothetical protein